MLPEIIAKSTNKLMSAYVQFSKLSAYSNIVQSTELSIPCFRRRCHSDKDGVQNVTYRSNRVSTPKGQ